MRYPKKLKAFSEREYINAHKYLASKVATMMGRKFEEGDWDYVYCGAKNIPSSGWSNLDIDVIYDGHGIEHKMLCRPSKKPIRDYCGTTLMHPSATRSIRIPSTDGDPTEIARDVLIQYANLIERHRKKVTDEYPGIDPDMRIGWLLWKANLVEFLYFEEEMLPPDPNDYYAIWRESGGGTRKSSRNLWIYEKETKRKRYSVTTSAGQKIQPYFDIPPPDDPNLYYFCVQGQSYGEGLVQIWITSATELLLKEKLETLDIKTLSDTIIEAAADIATRNSKKEEEVPSRDAYLAQRLFITEKAYRTLKLAFEGVSDEHLFQLFVQYLYR